MKQIALTKGYVALVDDEDFEELSQWKWRALVKPRTVYAIRHSAGRRGGTIHMGRDILGISLPVLTDHINGNGLDNRRVNLRECTRQENNRNSRSRLGSSSRYLGVCWNKQMQKWQAGIKVGGRLRHLGYFAVETEAGSAYKAAAAIAYGEFASGVRGCEEED